MPLLTGETVPLDQSDNKEAAILAGPSPESELLRLLTTSRLDKLLTFLSNKSSTANPHIMVATVDLREAPSPTDKAMESVTSPNIHTLTLLDPANTQAVTLESESLTSLTSRAKANPLCKLL